MPLPVLKVISCDYVFVHPGLGVMGVVECFRVFARLFDFLYIERLHQEVVGFPWEKGPYTLADKLRTDWNEIKPETFWGRFLWNLSCRSIRIQTIYNSVNLSNMSASFSMNFLFAVWWKTSSSATFCIFIAINLTHIGTGIYVMVHFKKLNSPKSVVLLEWRFARGIWFIDKKTKLLASFFFLENYISCLS